MMTLSVYLLNVIDALNQSDQPVPCRAGEDARFFNATDSTIAKRGGGSVFSGLMTLYGAIWSRYQRTVLMR